MSDPTQDDALDYELLFQEAYAKIFPLMARDVVRRCLQVTAASGLPPGHHFYLTFKTEFPGVVLAQELRDAYPETMTIILQHQFQDLEVDEEVFAVTLSFSGVFRHLVVPFAALVAFQDPDAQIALPLDSEALEDAAQEGDDPFAASRRAVAKSTARSAAESTTEDDEADARQDGGGNVVSIDAFRKR